MDNDVQCRLLLWKYMSCVGVYVYMKQLLIYQKTLKLMSKGLSSKVNRGVCY